MDKIKLSEEQINVANRAIDNALNKKQQSFISGPAGCGKTTIADEISTRLFELGLNVYFVAPTHTAANRLQKVLSEGDKQINVSTVHKFLKMRVISNNYGKTVFGITEAYEDIFDVETSILIVDEASMLSEELYKLITAVCKHRVIFLGDSAQIPPVTEDDETRTRLLLISDSKPPVERYVKCKFELKKVYRQDNETALYKLCTFLRDSIIDGTCVDLYDNKRKLIRKMQEFAQQDDDSLFLDIPAQKVVPSIIGINDTCFLGFGNPTVTAVQNHLPEWYVNGGYGISNSPVFQVVKQEGKTKYTMILPNNSHVRIDNIERRVFSKWGIEFDKVTVDAETVIHVPSNPDTFQDDYTNWINIAKYNAGLQSALLTTNQTLMYQTYGYDTLTNKSLNDFIATVTTLREGRASTIHRAQGQQWQNCIVAFNNILFAGVNMDKEVAKNDVHRKIIAMKLLYTAISRSMSKIVVCFETKKENYEPVQG